MKQTSEFYCYFQKRCSNTYPKNIKALFANVVSRWEKRGKGQHFDELREDVNTACLDTFPEGAVLRSERKA